MAGMNAWVRWSNPLCLRKGSREHKYEWDIENIFHNAEALNYIDYYIADRVVDADIAAQVLSMTGQMAVTSVILPYVYDSEIIREAFISLQQLEKANLTRTETGNVYVCLKTNKTAWIDSNKRQQRSRYNCVTQKSEWAQLTLLNPPQWTTQVRHSGGSMPMAAILISFLCAKGIGIAFASAVTSAVRVPQPSISRLRSISPVSRPMSQRNTTINQSPV